MKAESRSWAKEVKRDTRAVMAQSLGGAAAISAEGVAEGRSLNGAGKEETTTYRSAPNGLFTRRKSNP